MNAMYWKALGSFLLVVALAGAASPPGTVSSGGSIKVNSTSIPASAATSVPFNLGDKISTDDSAAVIRFDAFGVVVTVSPNSVVQTGEVGGKPFFRLLAGSFHYTVTDPATLALFKLDESVQTKFQGVVALVSRKVPLAWILGGAGAAAVGITTYALVTRSASCPVGQTC